MEHNHESRRRQYGLVDRARHLGWAEPVVIDDDLARSGGGVTRPGFERLLLAICEGRVGIVLAVEASRLGRIAGTPQTRPDELLPWNWEDDRRHDQAAQMAEIPTGALSRRSSNDQTQPETPAVFGGCLPIIRISPCVSVPGKESRSIPATQQLVATVDPNIKMWVIESHAGGLRINSVLNRNYPKLEALEGYTERIVDQPPHARVR